VRGLRRRSFRTPPWSDHVGRITRGVMNVSSSELAFVPVPPGRTCVSPGILASVTNVEFPLHSFELRRSLSEDRHTVVRGLPFRYRRCGASSEQLLLCREILANTAYAHATPRCQIRSETVSRGSCGASGWGDPDLHQETTSHLRHARPASHHRAEDFAALAESSLARSSGFRLLT
jgi:hypothetical protein